MKYIDEAVAKAEIIAVGDEILFGQITNTNARFLSDALDSIGIRVVQHTAIGDEKSAIMRAIDLAFERADIILMTGGLGPTKDDLTKYTLAEYFQSPLAINEEALSHVTAMIAKRGRTMNELNRLQALQPTKSTYIKNDVGTAPAMWFEKEPNKVLVSMPGVPFEMQYITKNEILPRLKAKYTQKSTVHYFIKTAGIAESTLATRIEAWEDALPATVSLAYLPSYGTVKLRLTSSGIDANATKQELQKLALEVLPVIGDYAFYHGDDISLESLIAQELVNKNLKLAIAESCTGGSLATLFTAMPGASKYLEMAIVPYQIPMKVKFLGIDEAFINQYGVVSVEVAREMALKVAEVSGAEVGIATTGVAGPDSGGIDKPVGTICLGYSIKGNASAVELVFGNQRETNIQLANNNLMRLLLRALRQQ